MTKTMKWFVGGTVALGTYLLVSRRSAAQQGSGGSAPPSPAPVPPPLPSTGVSLSPPFVTSPGHKYLVSVTATDPSAGFAPVGVQGPMVGAFWQQAMGTSFGLSPQCFGRLATSLSSVADWMLEVVATPNFALGPAIGIGISSSGFSFDLEVNAVSDLGPSDVSPVNFDAFQNLIQQLQAQGVGQ